MSAIVALPARDRPPPVGHTEGARQRQLLQGDLAQRVAGPGRPSAWRDKKLSRFVLAIRRTSPKQGGRRGRTVPQRAHGYLEDLARRSGRDVMADAAAAYPGESERHRFEVQMPFALALTNEELTDSLFDSVIVDEAQDFSDEYWFGVETLLKDPGKGTFYLFTDRNQAIYRRDAKLPIEDEPFHLTANCRNTAAVHALAYGFYTGTPVDASELAGPDVETVCLETDAEQAAEIERRVRRLLTEEKVSPSDVVVLLAKRPKSALYDLLSRYQLPGKAAWSFERRVPGTILVDTVARFKGLESSVVILWVGEEASNAEERETMYVGTSRAKYLLHIVGSTKACAGARLADAVLRPQSPKSPPPKKKDSRHF